MSVNKATIKVNIYGEEYPIKSEADITYVEQVALYVDKKMKEVADKLPQNSPAKVAVLAALNIADELYKEREEKEKQLLEVEKKASHLLEWLDHKLAEVEL
ncbi:MAG: hypothetical protein A2145_06270 [candidate division Zixibacteria bacterium RBG_16_40_9]|nr:MAG: hypothetical protein A2145_06270 [candidate division Zixibacteria bacterium RBG_16_40_9]